MVRRLSIALDRDVVIESANLNSGSAMSWSLQRASDPSGQCIASNQCSLMVSEIPSSSSFRHPFASDSDGSKCSSLQGVGATSRGATFRVPIRGSSLSSDAAIGCLVIQIDPSDTSGVLRCVRAPDVACHMRVSSTDLIHVMFDRPVPSSHRGVSRLANDEPFGTMAIVDGQSCMFYAPWALFMLAAQNVVRPTASTASCTAASSATNVPPPLPLAPTTRQSSSAVLESHACTLIIHFTAAAEAATSVRVVPAQRISEIPNLRHMWPSLPLLGG